MTGFVGTFTSTPVTDLRPGDQVQWYAELGTVLDTPTATGSTGQTVRFRLSLPNRIRPSLVRVSRESVLMAQRPDQLPNV